VEASIERKLAVLNLSYPFSENELKHSFRELAFKCHPDTGGAKEDFIKIKEAYDTLLPMALQGVLSRPGKDNLRTFEKDFIADLGKGQPSTINGVRCKKCLGQGYYSSTHREQFNKETCKKCGGTGFYFRSRGLSLSRLFFGMGACPDCGGTGGKYQYKTITLNHTCSNCGGTGETIVTNPALPKNRAPNRFKNEDSRPKRQYCSSCGALIRNGNCWRCNYKESGL